MKRTLAGGALGLLFLLSLGACSKDSYYPYSYTDPTIYSSANKALFSEIVFFINPYTWDNGTKKYILTDRLLNVSLTVNNETWEATDSYLLDTLHLQSKETIGAYRTTGEVLSFPFTVGMNPAEKPGTAGQYSDILNNYRTLQAGSYVCRVEYFDIKMPDGGNKRIYTNIATPLEVKDNTRSAYIGTFEVQVY